MEVSRAQRGLWSRAVDSITIACELCGKHQGAGDEFLLTTASVLHAKTDSGVHTEGDYQVMTYTSEATLSDFTDHHFAVCEECRKRALKKELPLTDRAKELSRKSMTVGLFSALFIAGTVVAGVLDAFGIAAVLFLAFLCVAGLAVLLASSSSNMKALYIRHTDYEALFPRLAVALHREIHGEKIAVNLCATGDYYNWIRQSSSFPDPEKSPFRFHGIDKDNYKDLSHCGLWNSDIQEGRKHYSVCCNKNGVHTWKGCICSACGAARDGQHSWAGGRCTGCGLIKEPQFPKSICKGTPAFVLRVVSIDRHHHDAGCLVTMRLLWGEKPENSALVLLMRKKRRPLIAGVRWANDLSSSLINARTEEKAYGPQRTLVCWMSGSSIYETDLRAGDELIREDE